MTDILIRSTELRADAETGVVEGIAVPWDTPISVGGIREQFARGAIEDVSNTKLYWQHGEIIGRVISGEDREDGYHVKAQISDTALGRDARTLIKDGAVDSFSVGFEPVEDREEKDGTITRTKVNLREVSAVSFPAYADAKITNVRESDTTNTPDALERSNDTMPEITATDLVEVRESVDELTRRFDTFATRTPDEPTIDTRSAGEVLKAIVSGDESTIRAVSDLQERAYTGGTSADSVVQNGWVGDLTRIFDATSGVLSSIFGTGPLPATGNSIEYSQLATDTTQVTQQTNEGDNLAFGKVVLEDKTSAVHTYGGYTTLSNQQIERSTLPVLNHSLNALAQAAGKRAKLELRTAYTTLVTARTAIASDAGVVSLGAKLSTATYNNWISAIVDAADKFDDESLSMDALVVSSAVFKAIAGFEATDGRPLLTLDGGVGTNTVGKLNVTALNGALAGLSVVLESGLTGNAASFVNGDAIRVYKSGLVSLQDQNIINLSKDFSVYRYGAIAPEIPAGVVPVKITAEA